MWWRCFPFLGWNNMRGAINSFRLENTAITVTQIMWAPSGLFPLFDPLTCFWKLAVHLPQGSYSIFALPLHMILKHVNSIRGSERKHNIKTALAFNHCLHWMSLSKKKKIKKKNMHKKITFTNVCHLKSLN